MRLGFKPSGSYSKGTKIQRHISVKEAGPLKTFIVINFSVRDKDVSSTQQLLRLLRLWLSSLKIALKTPGFPSCSCGSSDTHPADSWSISRLPCEAAVRPKTLTCGLKLCQFAASIPVNPGALRPLEDLQESKH